MATEVDRALAEAVAKPLLDEFGEDVTVKRVMGNVLVSFLIRQVFRINAYA